jgi:ubiquinone/menaquinone biosynthesis C-methylase UbiE
MTVVEPGPGMGFFTMELARLVGRPGRVVAIDVQPKMLVELRRRAGKSGLLDRIDARHAPRDGMGLDDLKGQVDFVLAFAVVHELPSIERFFAEVSTVLKPGRRLLLAEPHFQVTKEEFAVTLQMARRCGFHLNSPPVIRWARSAVLVKV